MKTRRKALAVAAVLLVAGGSFLVVNFLPGALPIPPSPPGKIGNSTGVFRFAAAGDFGGPTDSDMLGLAKRIKAANASFLLGLGDLGYTSDEQGWCGAIKGQFPDVLVIAGNHDTTESGPGDIASDVTYCPFTLNVNVIAGPSTPGYGYEYYFDYPSTSPLVRFILIAAGVGGQLSYGFSAGSSHYNWVVDSVNDARSRGIPWVMVGMHKQCITVGAKTGCDMGQAMFDKLVDLKVDLILQAHDHVYERSKQLALSGTCTTVPAGGGFDADCVVNDGSSGTYPKGAGSVTVIQGTGGQSQYSVRIDGSDAEIGYFTQVMGGNANTQGRTSGYGFVLYSVSADRIVASSDFCPSGQAGSDGTCASVAGSTFSDSFQIVRPQVGSPLLVGLAPPVLARSSGLATLKQAGGDPRLRP